MMEPMTPSTILQKIIMWTCITDFAITPEIRASETYVFSLVCGQNAVRDRLAGQVTMDPGES